MKKIFTLIVLACLTSVSAMAQRNFPKLSPRPTSTKPLAAPAKVASVKDKTYYCGVQLDLLRRAGGLATFNLKDPMNSLTILNTNALDWISDADYDTPIAAAYAEGKYYAFIGKTYTFVTSRKYWGTFDLETGDFTKIADAEPSPTFNNDDMYADYSPVYSMAYDNKNKKMYALYYDVSGYTGGFLNCVLATVDLKTGALTKVGEFDKIFYSIAIDHFGKMYGLTYKTDTDNNIVGTNLYRINDDKGNFDIDEDGLIYEEALIAEVKSSDGESFVGGTLQDMDFDNDAYVIRWNRISSAGTYLSELNPETGVYSNSQLIGSNATVVGIYSPYTPADSPEAPGHVENLIATSGANGATSVTLTWTNPTTAWNNHEVSAVTEVHIYRGEEMIGIVTDGVEKGGQSTFTDTEAAEGYNTYKVVPCRNEDEEGVPTAVEAFVGLDQPGAVQNLTLTSPDGIDAQLSWEAPAEGLRGGWYDPATLTYTITRQPDNVVVATDITATTFTDNTLTTTKDYSYTVKTKNAQGEGLEATSNALTFGPAIKPPYSASFTTEEDANMWTAFDANGDGDGWRYEAHPWYAWISTNWGNTGNDWLFSPEFQLDEGSSYRVSFCLYKPYHSSGGKEYARFAYGKGANVDAMTNVMQDEKIEIDNYDNRYYSYTITAPETGKFNFGINSLGEASNWGIYFTAFNITTISSKDLEATSVSGPSEISAGVENNYTVTVTNKGAVTTSNYEVQLVDDDENVLATTTVTDELTAQATKDVKVAWAPNADLANSDVTIYGRVICSGDGNKENNYTDGMNVKVGEVSNFVWVDYPGEADWATVTDNLLIPFGYTYMSTWSETIYDSALMNLAEGEYEVSKISYDYTFGTNVEAEIQVYAGTTEQTAFGSGEDIIPQKQMTLVYDGAFDITRGSGDLIINFSKPITFKAGEQLVIAIDRKLTAYSDGDIFDNKFATLEAPQNASLWFASDNSSYAWSGDTEETHTTNWVPVTHFFVNAGNCDGIEEIENGKLKIENSAAYNIAGQRLNTATTHKGIIIVNGKKVLK